MTDKDFIDWIVHNQERLAIYKDYLTYLGIDFNSNIVELNKGKFDSISSDSNMIISPFGETLDREQSNLLFYDKTPIIISNSKISTIPDIDLFITHNPYSIDYLAGMDKLHNIGYNISFGVFGDTSDLDIKEKLKYIKYLKNKISQDYDIEYDTVNNTYMCIIKSKRKVKVLRKTL